MIHEANCRTAVFPRRGEIGRHPGKQSPVGEHQRARNRGRDADRSLQGSGKEVPNRGFGPPDSAPRLRFLNVAPDPDCKQCRRHTHHKKHAPSMGRNDPRREQGRRDISHGPARLQDADGLAAMPRRPLFGDRRRSSHPRPAHSQPHQQPPQHQFSQGVRRCHRKCRVGENRYAQCLGPSESVCHVTEGDSAGRRRKQRHGCNRSGNRGGEAELLLNARQGECVRHYVHAVEHPGEGGGGQSPPLPFRRRATPCIPLICRRPPSVRAPARAAPPRPSRWKPARSGRCRPGAAVRCSANRRR